MIAIWSGVQPFIIMPNHVVGVVTDAEEDQEFIKKQLRKLANNILIYLRDKTDELDPYMAHLWELISQKQWDDIVLEKPPTPALSPLPHKPAATSGNDYVQASDSEDFDSIISLQSQVQEISTGDDSSKNRGDFKDFSANPFGNSSSEENPFGGPSSGDDPFGGSISGDPFGSSHSISAKKSGQGTNLKYNPNLFGSISAQEPSSTEDQSNAETDVDPFAEDPWAQEKPKKKQNDEFDENPF